MFPLKYHPKLLRELAFFGPSDDQSILRQDLQDYLDRSKI
jgi:hypothetical protein